MNLQFALNNLTQGRFYVGYTPVICSLKFTDGQVGASPVNVTIANTNPQTGGQLEFYSPLTQQRSATLTLPVPGDGTQVSFYVGGKLNFASSNDLDAGITFTASGNQSLGNVSMMVRVRKNANTILPEERDRFLNAFVSFAQSGNYQTFIEMHDENTLNQMHGRSAFLPWHRNYVLDLERHLQQIDASVTIPYWNFQEPAPNVFSLDFAGLPPTSGTGPMQYSQLNPLNRWKLKNFPPLIRIPDPKFNTQKGKALVENESTTLGRNPAFADFTPIEINPHGNAHTSFAGVSPINLPATAPQDPLFFLLHCNVDRIWAAWQVNITGNSRFDGTTPDGYNTTSRIYNNPTIGDFINDTMWPWNNVTGSPRPATAPGHPMIGSIFTSYPGPTPKIIDMVDYQGRITNRPLYFDYDNIGFFNAANPVNAPGQLLTQLIRPNLFAMADLNSKLPAGIASKGGDKLNRNEIAQSLNAMEMPTDTDSIDRVKPILQDKKNDAGLRALALSKLLSAVSSSEELLLYVLNIIGDKKDYPELREEAFRTLRTISFSSKVYLSLMPQIDKTLRGIIRDNVQSIREQAISYLVLEKDEYVQRKLIEGLRQPSKALIPQSLAIHLLGNDPHVFSRIFPILRRIVTNSSDFPSRYEAIHLLGSDRKSAALLTRVFQNKDERADIRQAALLALRNLSSQVFSVIARRTALDEKDFEDVRVLSLGLLGDVKELAGRRITEFKKNLGKLNTEHQPESVASAINSYLLISKAE